MFNVYDLVPGRNCARFVYHGIPRVVRLISMKDGIITGYETKKGSTIHNIRHADVKSFKIDKIRGGKIKFSSR